MVPLTSDVIIAISTLVQALATVVLVGVTIYYAYQARLTVRSMNDGSKAEFLPVIMIGVNRVQSNENTLVISVENVGKGLAKRPVKIILPGKAPIYINSIPATAENATTARIDYDIEYILSLPQDERKIVIEYRDIFNRAIRTEAPLIEIPAEGNLSRIMGWEVWHPIIP